MTRSAKILSYIGRRDRVSDAQLERRFGPSYKATLRKLSIDKLVSLDYGAPDSIGAVQTIPDTWHITPEGSEFLKDRRALSFGTVWQSVVLPIILAVISTLITIFFNHLLNPTT